MNRCSRLLCFVSLLTATNLSELLQVATIPKSKELEDGSVTGSRLHLLAQ